MDYQNDIVPFEGAVLANALFIKKLKFDIWRKKY